MADGVVVLDASAGAPLELGDGAGESHAVVGPHMGAEHRTMAVLRLPAGAASVVLRHPGEAVWYVAAGDGLARPEAGEELELDEGTMVHVEAGAAYRFEAGTAGLSLLGGPSPPDPEFGGAAAPAREGARVRKFHRDRPARRVPMISSDARLVVFPGVGAETANMNFVRLEPGEENVPHAHATSEDTIYILAGSGTVADLSNDTVQEFAAGNVIHVPPGVEHAVRANRGEGVVSVGGPCPPDRAMLQRAEG